MVTFIATIGVVVLLVITIFVVAVLNLILINKIKEK